jgi:methyltransferase (TIGR00027 family)
MLFLESRDGRLMRSDRPSGTALAIAFSLLHLSRRKDGARLVPPDEARIIEAGVRRLGALPRIVAALAGPPLGTLLARAIESCVVPGIIAHYALRKRVIESLARASLKNGFRQVVVLAAGFDMLASRLAREDPRLCLIEIDHPATQRAKKVLLGSEALPTLVAADLSERLPSAVLSEIKGYQARLPTLYIVEGLTMYLTRENVEALWTDLAGACASHARLICTFMEPDAEGRARFRRQTGLLGRFLSLTGERFVWGTPCANIGPMLSRCGWSLGALLGPEEFRALGKAAGAPYDRDQPVGEYILVADRPAAAAPALPPFEASEIIV